MSDYCEAVYKSGKKKGLQCANKAKYSLNDTYYCGVHCKDSNRIDISTGKVSPKKVTKPKTIDPNVVYCEALYKSGKKKGLQCANKASWSVDNVIYCGIHSKGYKEIRIPLKGTKVSPTKRKKKEPTKEDLIEKERKNNISMGQVGEVLLQPFVYGKKLEYIPGFLYVFPNAEHDDRKDGLGLSKLDPELLGPIKLNDEEETENLYNFMSYTKVYEKELDEDSPDGVTNEFFDMQIEGFTSFEAGDKYTDEDDMGKFLYHYWEGKKYNEVEFRDIYCNLYEKAVIDTKEFKMLKKKIDTGYNVVICGYGANSIESEIEDAYTNKDTPFTHERILFTMLTLDEEEYPWRVKEDGLEEIDEDGLDEDDIEEDEEELL